MSFVSSGRRISPDLEAAGSGADMPRVMRKTAPLGLPPDFVWIAAHQLRTRLCVLTAGLDDAGRLSRARIRRQVDQMRRLLDQLLVVALSDDDLSAKGQPFDLNALAAEVAAHFRPLVQSRRCCLHLETWESPVVVSGHYGLSFEALCNLVDNAIKYGGEEPCVMVRVCPFSTVTVEDDGPGVPAALCPRLFGSFNRSLNGSGNGAGLGLFIVSRVMAAQGGSISYQSGVPCGARFVMRFGEQ